MPTEQQLSPLVAIPAKNGLSLEDKMKQMVKHNMNFQQRTNITIQNLENQIG